MIVYVVIVVSLLAIICFVAIRSNEKKPRKIFSDEVIFLIKNAESELSSNDFNLLYHEICNVSKSAMLTIEALKGKNSDLVFGLASATASAEAKKLIFNALNTSRYLKNVILEFAKDVGIEVGDDACLRPDMKMAAKGYVTLHSLRVANPALDSAALLSATRGHLEALVGNEEPAGKKISADWGAAYAANDDVGAYYAALKAYDETVRESVNPPLMDRLEGGAIAHLVMVLAIYPDEFSRYLEFELLGA